MQKPVASGSYANDLADYDVIEEDDGLVLGPHPSKRPSCGGVACPPVRQLGSNSSFKDTSILGSAALMAKLAQSISAPNQPLLASRTTTLDSHVYANGNPVISTASVSRPSSASARQPRSSAPSGGAASFTEHTSAPTSNNHVSKTTGSDTSDTQQDGAELRMQGNIQGGSSTRPRSGLLRRLSSLTLGSRPPSARQEAAADGAAGAAAAAPTAATKKGTAIQQAGSRAQVELCPSITRSAAIPCVDVEPERRQLLRRLSLRENSTYAGGPQSSGGATRPRPLGHATAATGAAINVAIVAATTAVEPRALASSGGSAPRASASSGGTGVPSPIMEPTAAAVSAASLVTDAPASDRPPTPLRRLSRLLSNSIITSHCAVAAASADQRDQDGAGAAKRRPSSGGVRNLFSRPSSAKRKSEAGVWASSQQPPPPVEAWKQQQRQDSQDDRDVDGPTSDRVQEYGVVPVRQPGGIIKRAANALATALTR